MSVVSVFSGAFCRADEFIDHLRGETGYRLIDDEMIVTRARELSALPEETLKRVFSARTSVFNPFTRERERAQIWLKLAVAEYFQEAGLLLHGVTSHLIPVSIPHVLRVCLIADAAHRIAAAAAQLGIEAAKAAERIQELDHDRAAWVQAVHSASDPWDATLYDILLPAHKLEPPAAAALVRRHLAAKAVQVSNRTRRAAGDFLTAARIQAALAAEGHFIGVSVEADAAVLTIDRPVLMQERLEEELTAIVRGAAEVARVEVRVKPAAKAAAAYSRHDATRMSRVLLVDDEREFVQTLSERLGMRDIGSATAFDGESALELLREEEPEVMLLDLRMPGIDGMEVLKRVKADHPEIEVVILTGHGTDVDRKKCMELGAFAYLEKPVDIDVLSETLKKANEKMRANRRRQTGKEA
ncbi:MAG: response regulator [Desulfobacteraceae bacterium]|nr:MAG: response regulator [Desulfobacteraceae bacterium]